MQFRQHRNDTSSLQEKARRLSRQRFYQARTHNVCYSGSTGDLCDGNVVLGGGVQVDVATAHEHVTVNIWASTCCHNSCMPKPTDGRAGDTRSWTRQRRS